MPTKLEILNEYCSVHDQMNKIKTNIDVLKYETKIKISCAKTESDKNDIMDKYKKQLLNIKNDSKLKETFKKLKFRQQFLAKILTDNNDNTQYRIDDCNKIENININDKNISSNIDVLLHKYKQKKL